MSLNNFFRIRVLGVFLIFISGLCAQRPPDCGKQTDCGSCLQQLDCVWCTHPNLTDSTSPNNNLNLNRCIPRDSKEIFCSNDDRVDPPTNKQIKQDLPLGGRKGNILQMKPQKVDLTMRVGQTFNVEFQYHQAENYPVDLYFIADSSKTMKEYKKQLAELGNKLTDIMSNLTNEFRIGFGSFIDKGDLPFSITDREVYQQLCGNCSDAYDFKNHLSLTSDYGLFSAEVAESSLSANLDAPEGGFDALVQAIVCKKEIGWRPQARHIIVLSTDAEFHIAGDGKLAGVFERNDAKCHMVNNEYQGLENDYPSVSQLNQIVKENNVNIIFAIVETPGTDVLASYKMLSKHVDNTEANSLDKKSKNVVDLVVDNYKRIVGSVTMQANSPGNVHVEITPHCSNPIQMGCKDVRLGDMVNFTASIKLLDCAANSLLPTIIQIKPDGINESLTIEVKSICNCPCESSTDSSYKINAKECGGKGDLICGECKCKDGNQGTKCECSRDSAIYLDDTNCRENKNDTRICTGRGSCKCGTCECSINPHSPIEAKYRGRFCECDDETCEKENGKLCNDQGKCECGLCKCNATWTGDACGCKNRTDSCINEGDTAVCSGKGSCNCGRCNCIESYKGTFCEVCPDCTEECVELKGCVECTAFGSGKYDRKQCQTNCVAYDINLTDGDIEKEDEQEKICRVFDNDKCEFVYKYKYDIFKKLVVTVQKDRNCEPNILVWVAAVIGLVLLIGILTLLIWKIATSIHDKRDYVRFMKQQENSKWHRGDNPLYKGATTTFSNPHYRE